jgi:site-specific recombinase XerC
MVEQVVDMVASRQVRGDGQRTGHVQVSASACKNVGESTSLRRAAAQTDDAMAMVRAGGGIMVGF